ncbi:MAG: metallophosphoesterase, partial [Clostridia bacterium]|nr:metallophosphoesterase [Clostridia bacterium]
MKLMFASDIHGSRSAMEAILRQYALEGADRLVLLGDLLYHGPRNDLPDQYDPKGVTALLNANKNQL